MLRTRFGALVPSPYLEEVEGQAASMKRVEIALRILSRWNGDAPPHLVGKALAHGKSQLGQDFFALAANNFQEDGFFCEFGAGDGVHNSNSFMLETVFGWSGVLSEPNPDFFEMASRNRSTPVYPDAVWSDGGHEFELVMARELSTFSWLVERDGHGASRRKMSRFKTKVRTISLHELLVDASAPKEIGLLSIDTEGSELEILSSFPFSEFHFNSVCVEHNFREDQKSLDELFLRWGYVRVLEDLSEFDAWYVPEARQDKFRPRESHS